MIKKTIQSASLVLLIIAALWSSNWLRMHSAPLALVWPASGVAVYLFWRFGYKALWPIALASVSFSLWQGKDWLTVTSAAFAITSTGALALIALRKWHIDLSFARAGDALKFFAVTVAATALSSLLTATIDILGGWSDWQAVSKVWWACWLAEAMGIILLLPMLTTVQRLHVKNWHELALISVAIGVNAWLVYADVLPYGWAMSLPLTYTIFPLIIWAAFRLPNSWLAILLLLNGAAGILGTRMNMGPFILTSASESALALHGHLALVSITALMLNGAMAERRKMLKSLSASEARYRLIVENQSEWLVKCSATGELLHCNPVAQRFIQNNFLNWCKDNDIHQWVSDEQPRWAGEHTYQGSRLSWTFKWLQAEQTIIAVARDVTERYEADQRLRTNQQALARTSRINDMGQLAAGLAHELNQPLTAMMTFSQAAKRLLAQQTDDQDVQLAMDRVVANAERASEIIKQMRAFVRNEVPDAQWHNLTTLINDAVKLVSFEAKRRRVPIVMQVAQPVYVKVAEVSFHQVLVNILQNALEALAEQDKPEIRISVALVGQKAELLISDNGPGVPKDMLAKLFDPFVSSKANGVGLGLSLSQSIVESFDGQLSYLPGLGGAQFSIVLPCDIHSQQEQA